MLNGFKLNRVWKIKLYIGDDFRYIVELLRWIYDLEMIFLMIIKIVEIKWEVFIIVWEEIFFLVVLFSYRY